ncbi:hypothetical protein SAMN05216224_102744 [Thioclava dalianensis]|uniref:hypothetical protein n=1 Tax=Thioclava dalianensis TaxID=1185766 RepID=UPI0008F65D53|nr:hypothetical protein [Thioclava dalianensis]SFN16550.1 hypothetical protein SAMN05216224_102744 [Thioclava dalianensis]
MRLLVFGTSNSILKGGYVDALRSLSDVFHLDRIGPGGSTSIILPFFGADINFSNYDFVVIDTSINDGAFVGWGILHVEEILANIRWFCALALKSGCVPVILCMPNRRFVDTIDPAISAYKQVSEEFAIPLLDGYSFVRAIAAETSSPIKELFLDDLHLLPEISRQIAPRIISLCHPVFASHDDHSIPVFRRVLASDLSLQSRERRTSLLTALCAELSPNDCIEIALGKKEALSGIVYNAGHTFGSIICNGSNKVAVNVKSHYFQKNDLVVAARQVSPSVSGKDGIVRVHMQRGATDAAEIIGLVVSSV